MIYLFSFCYVFSQSLLAFRCLSDQSSALLQLKQEFEIQKPYFDDPSGVKNMDTWKASSDCCAWDGVTCNMSTGHVISLDLSNSGLRGPFHSNSSLFSLDHLQRLNLAFNDFNFSQIPSEFGKLSRLTHLNLSYSKFSRDIPSEVSLLINLVSLDLSGNYLFSRSITMQILVQYMTNLKELHLDEVNFNSAVPESLVNLTLLTALSLSGCYLKGEFPKEIFQLPNLHAINVSHNSDLIVCLPKFEFGSSLRLLDLSFTKFSGEIPDSIGKLKSLNVLDLKYCDLSGTVPSWIGNLTHLTHLDLSNNQFEGNLPVVLGNLSQLTYLDLSYNEFSSEFPSMLENLSRLIYLGLSSNNFNGSLPFSLSNNLVNLTVLELGSNQFSGQIPSSIGNLSQLMYLNLSHNHFHDKLPISLANLTRLLSLDLSENHFHGPIPSHILGNFNSMFKLNLSKNALIGVIPSSLFTMPSLKYLVLDDNLLTGPLCIKNISSSPLALLSLNGNKLSGQIPTSISKFANLRALLLQSNNLTGGFKFSVFPELNVLNLFNNSLTGTLPKCFAGSLSQLNVGYNNFNGNIPEMCTDDCNLAVLSLGHNQLRGKFPQSLSKCKELRILDVQDNRMVDTFPFSLQALPKLAVLSLKQNKFYGPIWDPRKFWGFMNMRIFDISVNEFSGNLPSKYFGNWSAMDAFDSYINYMKDENGYFQYSMAISLKGAELSYLKISTIYRAIDLSNNQFQGEIPDTIGDLKHLRFLNLSSNSFTSIIPLSIVKLTELESLDLSRNKLTGRIPEQLTDLVQLAVLNLSHNQLMGPIPQGYQFETFENDSYEGNMGLCGHPLSNECETFESLARKEPESDDSFDWKSILRGYVCGILSGLITGVIVGHKIISKKLNWYMETSADHIRSLIIRKRRS